LAAKLLSGVHNASYQANATRDAASKAVSEAQKKLAAQQQQLDAVKTARKAVRATYKKLPAKLGGTHFKVRTTGARVQSNVGSLLCSD
jgi:hypothetical protein